MGATDGSFICGLCGDWRTGCHLCGGAPLLDVRESLRREATAEFNAESELMAQERAIRNAADARRAGVDKEPRS